MALGDQVHLMDHETGKSSVIVQLNKGISRDENLAPLPYVCSISFDRSGEAISLGTSDKQIHIYDVQR